jgi:hypothetical protein
MQSTDRRCCRVIQKDYIAFSMTKKCAKSLLLLDYWDLLSTMDSACASKIQGSSSPEAIHINPGIAFVVDVIG